MRVKGTIEFTRRIDGDPLIVLPDSLDANEIRVCAAEDLAQPIPAHLVPRIKVRIRKMSGHSFASLQQVEEEQDLVLIEELGAVIRP
jgi:hypothetical protein